MDAGIQSQGREAVLQKIIIYNHSVTIRGTGFWHPCQNDGFDCTVSKNEYFAWSD
jgi:hypothetical protein